MIYNTLAHYYDLLVGDDQAADRWVEWVENYSPGPDFLELACGSGEITLRLSEKHHVSAMDLSQQMVEEASRKDTKLNIDFSVGDMRDLRAYGMYDAIGCFCDSFNYLLDISVVKKFFQEVAGHLNPGGLFFFDSHSTDRLEEFAEDYEETGTFEDGTGLQWIIAAEQDYLFQDFAFYFEDKTIQEHHMQRVYTPDAIMEALDPWFDIISVTTDFDLEGIAPGEKYFFVCRLKSDLEW